MLWFSLGPQVRQKARLFLFVERCSLNKNQGLPLGFWVISKFFRNSPPEFFRPTVNLS